MICHNNDRRHDEGNRIHADTREVEKPGEWRRDVRNNIGPRVDQARPYPRAYEARGEGPHGKSRYSRLHTYKNACEGAQCEEADHARAYEAHGEEGVDDVDGYEPEEYSKTVLRGDAPPEYEQRDGNHVHDDMPRKGCVPAVTDRPVGREGHRDSAGSNRVGENPVKKLDAHGNQIRTHVVKGHGCLFAAVPVLARARRTLVAGIFPQAPANPRRHQRLFREPLPDAYTREAFSDVSLFIYHCVRVSPCRASVIRRSSSVSTHLLPALRMMGATSLPVAFHKSNNRAQRARRRENGLFMRR
jgi:hypothetical protein